MLLGSGFKPRKEKWEIRLYRFKHCKTQGTVFKFHSTYAVYLKSAHRLSEEDITELSDHANEEELSEGE